MNSLCNNIKVAVFLLFALFSIKVNSQTNKLNFQYDIAGNQIVRSLCINCTVQRSSSAPAKENSLPLEKFFPEDVISYYPNPVKEELYLEWELINDNAVSSIKVYSLSGQLLKSYQNLGKKNSEKISFQEYAMGVYTVLLNYSNGENKSIKIIKQ